MSDTWKDEVTNKNIRRGLTFAESKPHVFITDFSPKAWRRAYIKALFYENERWIRCIEHWDSRARRFEHTIVDCKESQRIDKNAELRAELKDQICNNLEYRKGYYEAIQCGKPTTEFAKYLHPDVRRFIQKYHRYKNASEVLNGDREICDRNVRGKVIQYDERANRSVAEPKEPTIRTTLPEEAIISR
jgi:hypothetical protein